MTYKELRDELNKLTDNQLQTPVVVCNKDDEYYEAEFYITSYDDVLTKGHPFLDIAVNEKAWGSV